MLVILNLYIQLLDKPDKPLTVRVGGFKGISSTNLMLIVNGMLIIGKSWLPKYCKGMTAWRKTTHLVLQPEHFVEKHINL